MKVTTLFVGGALVASTLFAPRSALADVAADKKQCGKSYESAQVSMKKDSLREARAELEKCTLPACAAFVREECSKWTREIDDAMPSVLLVFSDAAGASVTPSAFTVDGVATTIPAAGSAMELDPGKHILEASRGAEHASLEVTTERGKKNFAAKLVFPAPVVAETKPVTPPPIAEPPKEEKKSGSLVLPIAIGGLGVAAIATSLVLGAMAKSDLDDLDACKGHCEQSKVDSIDTKTTIATVVFGAGIVALGVSAYFILTRDKKAASSAPRALFVF